MHIFTITALLYLYNLNQMAHKYKFEKLSYGFVFPKNTFNNFRLIHQSTIGYISDNIFYKLNLATSKAETTLHPQGRTYQSLTANHKRGLIVLADYGKQSSIYFDYLQDKNSSFWIRDVCPLEITLMELSLDGKYLAVVCGSPTSKLIIIDVEKKAILKGSRSSIDLKSNIDKLKKIDFNPSNKKIFSLMFENEINIYDIKDCFELNQNGQIQEGIAIKINATIPAEDTHIFQTLIWDQINNLYISNGNKLFLYSTDIHKQVLTYDIEVDSDQKTLIRSLILTLKHIIVFYSNGRVEWLIKYYPDLMEEEEAHARPFQLDKFYEISKVVNHAVYDHHFTKILVSHSDGYFSVLPVSAQSNEAEDEEEDGENKKNKKENKKLLQIDVTFVGPYHISPIILIKQIEGTSLCISVSTDGRIILWSLKQKRQVHFFNAKIQAVCADINKKFNVLALGLTNGVIQFYSIANFENIYLFKEFRLTKGTPIDQAIFSTHGDEIAILTKAEHRVYYLVTNLNLQFQVMGYVVIPYPPLSICWNSTSKTSVKPKYEHLLVCIGFGLLMINSPSAAPTKKRGKQLQIQSQIYALRTDLDQYHCCVLPSGQIITTGEDKFLKKYKQPDELLSKVDFKSKTAIPPPLQEYDSHDLAVTCLQASARGFVSGGADGMLHVREYSNFNALKVFKVHGWKESNLKIVSKSAINGIIYSGSQDGCFQIWKILDGEITLEDQHKIEQVNFKSIDSARNNLKYYEAVIEEEYLQRMKDIINNKKKVQFEKIDKIKKELTQLLAQNDKHDELQKLSRDEFAIDLQSRQLVAQQGKERCMKIREESKKKIYFNEVYAKKLKQISWDRMDIHLKAINGLKNNYIVYNYQIRKTSKEEKRRIKVITDLRKLQKIETKKRSEQDIIDPQFYKNKNVVNGGVIQPLILSIAEKKDEKKEEKNKKKKEEQVQPEKQEQAQQIFNEEEWSLLYSAFELYSDNAKKNQIIMMQGLIFKIKETFNKEFQKLMKYRQNQNQIINDKNKRIIQICEELKRPNQVLIGKKNILESSERVLQVDPNQIPFKRYLSKQQRQKLEKQRLKEQQRLRKLAEDDSSQRALSKMMGGTLQQKKTSVLQINVERQKWMDKPVEQMSEEEKAKMKEYQQKKLKAQEQKERIVKKLEAELRKLKQQIDDIMEKYDEKLFNLVKRRIEYDYRIQEQQLYCTKLYLSIVNYRQQSKRYQQLTHKIEGNTKNMGLLSKQKEQILIHQEELEKIKEAKKASLDMKRLGDIQSKIKTIEKSVFEEYHSNLKKRRDMEQKFLEAEPSYKNQIIPLDPMKEIQSKNLSIQKQKDFSFFLAQIKVLQQSYEIPQASLFQILQNRFNIKKEQAQYEAKIRVLKDSVVILQEKINEQNSNYAKLEEQLQQIKQFLSKLKSDLDIQCRIKQGQVEINNDTPVPQLDEALLINKSQIDSKNNSIMVNANEKIEVMKQIKTCKISVTEETLDLEKKEDLINKYSSRIKEIQMLKVKKEMQLALAKKDTKINENQLRSLKEQIEKVRKEGEKRIALFEKKIQKIIGEIQSIKKQNKQLQAQRWNLQTTVKQRQKIKDMMVGENGEGNQQAKEKFDQISINRKLFDKAKQQTQQIELLREQLSKLKAKTFANFSNVQR